jgi:SPP1 gp7 family putative phage head morphogenesis protein
VPIATPPGLLVGTIEPRDAIAAFEQRKLLQPSFRWQDVWQEEHTRALAVAGVQRLDVLQVFEEAFKTKFAQGGTLADFAKAVRPELAAKGFWGDVEITDPATGESRITRFDNRRLQLIYDVNVRQSYAAGQWARIERNKARMPFIIYRTMDDDRVRPEHAAWNNLVLPVDHPFWQAHFPPCGWRCRCKAFALDQAGIDRLKAAGKVLQFDAPPEQLINYVNPRTGEVAAVPKGIDPGFAYNPGKARDEQLHEQTLRKAWAASPLSGAVAVAQATFARPEMITAATAQFGQWAGRISQAVEAGSFQRGGVLQAVTALSPQAVRALATAGVRPASAVVGMWDADMAKAVAGVSAADLAVMGRLPVLMERPSAILVGPGNTLLVLIELLGASKADAVLAVGLDVLVQQPGATDLLNLVRSLQVTTWAKVRRNKQLKEVWRRG